MTLSVLIQTARKKRGMTLAQLASEVGYDPSHFALLERGVRRLDEEAAVRVALVLGLDPTEAVMAAVRERLPEALRRHLPASAPIESHQARHAATRESQAEHFDFEIKLSQIHATSDWDGNLRIVRTLDECRPNAAMRPVSEISFRERAIGSAPEAGEAPGKFALLRAPKGLEYDASSSQLGNWVYHRLFFPRGWRRKTQQKDDAFSFRLESQHHGGLALQASDLLKRAEADGVTLRDPGRGSLNAYVRHHVKRLEVTLELPPGYDPSRWQPWVRWGQEAFESAAHDLGDRACRSMSFRPRGNVAKLVVEEPLAGYTFSIQWIPLDHQQYLEARYGD